MTAPSSSAHTVVIGGGLIGCAIAWRLAQRGAPVTLLERDRPGHAASWAAAGLLSPHGATAHDHPDFLALAQRSLAAYPQFVRELAQASGIAIEFGSPGKLDVGQEPPRWYADDAFVDNRTLSQAAQRAARNAGAQLIEGRTALGIATHAGAITGVQTGSGSIECEQVIIAAGAWSGGLQGLPRPLPVFPVRGQMLALQHDGSLPHMLQSDHCYLIPRSGGRVLVGATVEQVGFETGTTDRGLSDLLGAARALVPSLEHAQLIESWYGFRPGTPDELPILGLDPDVRGLMYATGHYRNGILLAPVTAELMTELAEGRAVPEFDAFGCTRFQT